MWGSRQRQGSDQPEEGRAEGSNPSTSMCQAVPCDPCNPLTQILSSLFYIQQNRDSERLSNFPISELGSSKARLSFLFLEAIFLHSTLPLSKKPLNTWRSHKRDCLGSQSDMGEPDLSFGFSCPRPWWPQKNQQFPQLLSEHAGSVDEEAYY